MGAKLTALLLLLATGLAGAARAQDCPTRPYWPTREWHSRVVPTNAARPAQLKALEDYAYTDVGADCDVTRLRTDAVLVIQNGEIVHDRQVHGYDSSGKRHISWALAASITNVLTGVAVQRGVVHLDDSICKYLSDVASDHCAITIQHLLESASGLEWIDAQDTASKQAWSLQQMLYGDGHGDTARFVVDQPLRDKPGTSWHESAGDATLLAHVVDAAMQVSSDGDWPWSALFDHTGTNYLVLERDLSGGPLGGTHVWGMPWDFARIGFLFLNDGCWDGQRLLPAGWVVASTTVPQPYRSKKIDAGAKLVPGRLWWLNKAVPEQNTAKPWPQLPDDSYAAIGQGGQYIVVIPALDLLIVRTGDDGANSVFNFEKFVLLAMALATP